MEDARERRKRRGRCGDAGTDGPAASPAGARTARRRPGARRARRERALLACSGGGITGGGNLVTRAFPCALFLHLLGPHEWKRWKLQRWVFFVGGLFLPPFGSPPFQFVGSARGVVKSVRAPEQNGLRANRSQPRAQRMPIGMAYCQQTCCILFLHLLDLHLFNSWGHELKRWNSKVRGDSS